MEVIKEEDRAKEEELVEVMLRLSARTTESRDTSCAISQILHTLHVNNVDNSTMP